MRTRPTYTEEFKEGAVRLLLNNDRGFKEVADSMGVSVWSLREWYKNSDLFENQTNV